MKRLINPIAAKQDTIKPRNSGVCQLFSACLLAIVLTACGDTSTNGTAGKPIQAGAPQTGAPASRDDAVKILFIVTRQPAFNESDFFYEVMRRAEEASISGGSTFCGDSRQGVIQAARLDDGADTGASAYEMLAKGCTDFHGYDSPDGFARYAWNENPAPGQPSIELQLGEQDASAASPDFAYTIYDDDDMAYTYRTAGLMRWRFGDDVDESEHDVGFTEIRDGLIVLAGHAAGHGVSPRSTRGYSEHFNSIDVSQADPCFDRGRYSLTTTRPGDERRAGESWTITGPQGTASVRFDGSGHFTLSSAQGSERMTPEQFHLALGQACAG